VRRLLALLVLLAACAPSARAEERCVVNTNFVRPYRLVWSVCYELDSGVGQQAVVQLRNRHTGTVVIRRGDLVWHVNDLSTVYWRRRFRFVGAWVDYETRPL